MLLLGCAPQEQVPSGAAGADASDEVASVESNEAGAEGAEETEPGQFSIDHITSCDQVAGAVAPYIEGLAPLDSNVVDEWGISCTWEAAEDETDFANNRSVEVGLTALEPGEVKPDPEFVLKLDGSALVEDSWIDSSGGIAYSLGMTTSVVGVISTTVWLPGVQAQITGGQWDGMPALDGAASVEVVKSLVQ